MLSVDGVVYKDLSDVTLTPFWFVLVVVRADVMIGDVLNLFIFETLELAVWWVGESTCGVVSKPALGLPVVTGSTGELVK